MWRDSNEFNWQVIGDYLCLAGISYLEIEKEGSVSVSSADKDRIV